MNSFDVIVIGSGPAGSSAAISCARKGLKVLVITGGYVKDDESELDSPESIHPGVVSYMDSLGLGQAVNEATLGYYYGIYQNGKYTALGKDEQGAWQGVHILRDVFDQHLLLALKNADVTVMEGEKVEDFLIENERIVGVKTKTGEWFGRYCIDASGKSGIAGKKLNFRRRFFSPALFCWTGISGDFDHYTFDQSASHFIPEANGWTWLAPLPPNQCAWTRLTMSDAKEYLPPEEIKHHPLVGTIRFANMRWRLYRPAVKEGIVLCGDAAGILDPAAGQGILNALRSGVSAANCVKQCIRDPDRASFHLALYDQWFVQMFEEKVEQLKSYYEEMNIE